MPRTMLRDDQWERFTFLLQRKRSDRGRSANNNLLSVEAVLWIGHIGSLLCDLPVEFGPWNSAYVLFARWSGKQIWHKVFAVLRQDADFEEVYLDSTVVRAHQYRRMPLKKWAQVRGHSRDGLTTKAHPCVEELGQLMTAFLLVGKCTMLHRHQLCLLTSNPTRYWPMKPMMPAPCCWVLQKNRPKQ